MELIEEQSEQLVGVLPKEYTIFPDDLLGELLRIFNNNALDDVGGDVIITLSTMLAEMLSAESMSIF